MSVADEESFVDHILAALFAHDAHAMLAGDGMEVNEMRAHARF
jgi:hypothetical protein